MSSPNVSNLLPIGPLCNPQIIPLCSCFMNLILVPPVLPLNHHIYFYHHQSSGAPILTSIWRNICLTSMYLYKYHSIQQYISLLGIVTISFVELPIFTTIIFLRHHYHQFYFSSPTTGLSPNEEIVEIVTTWGDCRHLISTARTFGNSKRHGADLNPSWSSWKHKKLQLPNTNLLIHLSISPFSISSSLIPHFKFRHLSPTSLIVPSAWFWGLTVHITYLVLICSMMHTTFSISLINPGAS